MARKIVVCCDGTWCGDPTGTTTNIKILADCIAGPGVCLTSGTPYPRNGDNLIVCYYEGVGVAGSFGNYIVNGAVANDIADKCTQAYRFIVDYFKEGSEVWMFGLSRGAHTVRSVAGMINNFGILDNDKMAGRDIGHICNTIYNEYRNRDQKYAPRSNYAESFRRDCCHSDGLNPPIRFMGLLDTVGALGVPKIGPDGIGYEFYDQIVSSEVKVVCQALAVHDRLSIFKPCFVRRSKNTSKWPGVRMTTKEVWFQGAHYDIGRQRFVFPRNTGNILEVAVNFFSDNFNALFINIEPTDGCSTKVLKWMMRVVREEDNTLLMLNEQEAIGRYYTTGLLDWIWGWRPHVPVLKKDAYDWLVIEHLLVMPVLWILLFTPFYNVILVDRTIPADGNAAFYSSDGATNEADFRSGLSGYRSRTYDTYRDANPGGIMWDN
jgi:Uncharacterized alpha/beta hydrolase domain (DUF2235)